MTEPRFRTGIIVVLLLLATCSKASETDISSIAPFSTDGCSAFPDGTSADQERWQACCIAHDLAYWAGGDYADRLAVDEALAECVADVGEPAIAKLMLAGVRAGGSPYFPTSYRWGYGWRHLRGYKPLTDAEKEMVLEGIDRILADALLPQIPTHYLQWPSSPPANEK